MFVEFVGRLCCLDFREVFTGDQSVLDENQVTLDFGDFFGLGDDSDFGL